jgi:hypothetical protein
VQLLRAHGCRVLGIDFDADKLALAEQFGAEVVNLSAGEDQVAAAQRFSRGRGVDAVIITASSKSSEPVHQAALMSRKRGRIVLVGVTGLELSRADFFEKELTFQVSCSYGPGRYDPLYEDKGQDYPVGFVRWTEQRNFEAVLDMLEMDGLEVFNAATMLEKHNQRAREYAKRRALPMTAGSDAHHHAAIGRSYTTFGASELNVRAILESLKQQPALHCEPLGLKEALRKTFHNWFRLGIFGSGRFMRSSQRPRQPAPPRFPQNCPLKHYAHPFTHRTTCSRSVNRACMPSIGRRSEARV